MRSIWGWTLECLKLPKPNLQIQRMCSYVDTKLIENTILVRDTELLQELGRLGGLVKSEVKSTTARENGKKGGRPAIKQLDLEDI